MNNKNMTAKERGLLKGAARRVFSRSDLRREALQKSIITHVDETRPRVKKWSRCPDCQRAIPTYKMEVDHVLPIVPLNTTLEDMSWDTLIDNLWCDIINLRALCEDCHKIKTSEERKLRNESKRNKKSSTKRS